MRLALRLIPVAALTLISAGCGPNGTAVIDASARDAAKHDGSTNNAPKPVVSFSSATLWGVMSNGLAVYSNFDDNKTFVLDITGPTYTPNPVVDPDSAWRRGSIYNGLAMFMWGAWGVAEDSPNGIENLKILNGSNAQVSANYAVQTVAARGAASADATLVAYFGDATVADANDLNATLKMSPPTLSSQINLGSWRLPKPVAGNVSTTCQPLLAFAGTPSMLVVTKCASGESTGAIVLYNSSGVPTQLTTDTHVMNTFALNQNQTKVAFIENVTSGTGTLKVASLSTTPAPVTIDTGVADAFLSIDGATVFYQKGASIKSCSTATCTTPTVVAASGVVKIISWSPDQSRIVYSTNADGAGNIDLKIVKADGSNSSAPIDLCTRGSSLSCGVPLKDAFTANSSYAFFTKAYSDQSNPDHYRINAMPMGGGMLTQLGAAWSILLLSTRDAKAVLGDNFTLNGSSYYNDLRFIDTATAGLGAMVCEQADYPFALSSDKSKVVFAVQNGLSTSCASGLYILTVP